MGAGPPWAQTDPHGLVGFYSYKADISWLVLAGFYCVCKSSYITFKLLCMWSPMNFPWFTTRGRGSTMLIYYNDVILKQRSGRIICKKCSHDSPWFSVFQKVGTTDLRTGFLSCINVPCPSYGVLWSFYPPVSCLNLPLRNMVLKNLFGVVEGQRSFFCNFLLRRGSSPCLSRTTELSPYPT